MSLVVIGVVFQGKNFFSLRIDGILRSGCHLRCSGAIAYTGVLSLGLAYSLQIVGQKRLEATTASLLMSLESVFAVLGGWLILKERMDRWELAGCVLMLAAVIVSQLPEKKQKV